MARRPVGWPWTRAARSPIRPTAFPLLSYSVSEASPAQEAPAAIRDTPRRSWEQDRQDVDDWFQAARTDPAVARQILGVLTHSRTREAFDRERRFMISYGIPGSFLPEWPAGTAHDQRTDSPSTAVR